MLSADVSFLLLEEKVQTKKLWKIRLVCGYIVDKQTQTVWVHSLQILRGICLRIMTQKVPKFLYVPSNFLSLHEFMKLETKIISTINVGARVVDASSRFNILQSLGAQAAAAVTRRNAGARRSVSSADLKREEVNKGSDGKRNEDMGLCFLLIYMELQLHQVCKQ